MPVDDFCYEGSPLSMNPDELQKRASKAPFEALLSDSLCTVIKPKSDRVAAVVNPARKDWWWVSIYQA